MAKKFKIVINGKFLSAPQTAVHKVAEEYTLALDNLLGDAAYRDNFDISLIVPPGASRHLVTKNIPIAKSGMLRGFLWEQIHLLFYSRSALLLNFCNLGPALRGNCGTLIHDVQAYTAPESNSKRFKFLYKTVTPLICRFHKFLFTVSHFSASELLDFAPRRPDVEVLHNGCDHILRVIPDMSIATRLNLDVFKYCVALANAKPHKNIGLLIRAFQNPMLSGTKLVLFGSASRASFEKDGLVVPENVVFTGRLSDEEVAGLMKNAGVLAFPSLTEGFGLPPLEAMALGCPALVAPCGSLPEVCGEAASYAGPDAVEDWVSEIHRIVTDVGYTTALREKGMAHSEKFRWTRSAQKLLQTVAKVH